MENITNISINKEVLNSYLSDFHESKIEEIKSNFSEEDFDCGEMVFVAKMKSKISMPQVGKFTKSYWISRGWSVKDAEEKREKRKVGKKSPMCIEFWLERGFTEEESIYKIRSQRKINVEYWLDRGYSIEESKSKIREFQTENNHKRNQKLENDIDFRNNMKSKQSMFIEYWLEKGFNEEESKKRLSERQSTFSLKKCIEKHGEEKGSIIWKDRQIKWKNSLLESGYDGKKGKDSKSIEHIKKNSVIIGLINL